MTTPNLVEMEIFRTGDYGPKGSYTEADLDSIATDYRSDLLEAPLTFDHAQSGPAFGWVSRMRREGDRLIAAFKGVPAAVLSLMKDGAYKRRSVELFRALPHTGRPYLRAVSLLGAATPEVKGLRDVCFASQEGTCAVEFREQTDSPGADQIAIAPSADAAVPIMSDIAPAQPVPVLPDVSARLSALFGDLQSEGYCLAESDAAALRELFSSDTAAAAADGVHDGLDCLARILRQGLLRAPLGEQAAQTAASTFAHATDNPHQFSDRISRESIALHQGALQIMAETPAMAYRDALLRASR